MAIDEGLTLDGLSLNDITNYVLERLEFTPARKRIELVGSADSDGELPVDEVHYTNAEFLLRVRVARQSTMDLALSKVGSLTDKLQKAEVTEGGIPVIWTPAGSTKSATWFAISGEIDGIPTEVVGEDAGWFVKAPVLSVRLVCRPFGYGSESSTAEITSDLPLIPFDIGDRAYRDVVMADSPRLYWRLGESAGTTANDEAGGNDNGTYAGGVTLGVADALAGDADTAVELDGTDDRIASTLNPLWDGTWTTEGWAWRDTSTSIDTLFGSDDATDGNRVTLHLQSGSQNVRFEPQAGGAGVTWAAAWPGNAQWVHWALVFSDGVNVSLYINGVLKSTQAIGSVSLTPGNLVVGARGTTTNPFDGKMDEFVVYQKRLSPERIFAHYVAGKIRQKILGDVPAEGRLVITDAATKDRAHVEWGLEQRHFDPANADSLLIDSDDSRFGGTSIAGAPASRTGAYDPDADGVNVIRTTLTTTPVVAFRTWEQGHVIGSFRVKARVFADTADTQLRLAWREGDTPFVRNAYATPSEDQFSEVDLGTITIRKAKAGAQRWEGQIEARNPVAGAILDIDYLALIPTERYGIARAPLVPGAATLLKDRDEFDQTAGALTGKVLPVGGTWSVITGSDADDFSVQATDHRAERTAVSDANLETGRYVSAGTDNQTNIVVQVSFDPLLHAGNGMIREGVYARLVDISNWLMAVRESANNFSRLRVYKRIAGTVTQLGSEGTSFPPGEALSVKLTVDTLGRWSASWWQTAGGVEPATPTLKGADSVLATAGTLASGDVGIYDAYIDTAALTRTYDNFATYSFDIDKVVNASQSLEIRHDTAIREDAGGTIFGEPPLYRGSRFFIPPAGGDAKTTRIAVKARRNDVAEFPDENVTDLTKAQAFWTPRHLNAPR